MQMSGYRSLCSLIGTAKKRSEVSVLNLNLHVAVCSLRQNINLLTETSELNFTKYVPSSHASVVIVMIVEKMAK
jgi:hypothetical protein